MNGLVKSSAEYRARQLLFPLYLHVPCGALNGDLCWCYVLLRVAIDHFQRAIACEGPGRPKTCRHRTPSERRQVHFLKLWQFDADVFNGHVYSVDRVNWREKYHSTGKAKSAKGTFAALEQSLHDWILARRTGEHFSKVTEADVLHEGITGAYLHTCSRVYFRCACSLVS